MAPGSDPALCGISPPLLLMVTYTSAICGLEDVPIFTGLELFSERHGGGLLGRAFSSLMTQTLSLEGDSHFQAARKNTKYSD
jgi:hypothetical protein